MTDSSHDSRLLGVPPQAPPPREQSGKGGLGVIGAVLLGLLAKGKSLLVFVKALPMAKLLLTSSSMIAMVAVEAWRSGIWFAIGFVLMILVHELGHGYAIKRRGLSAGWPIFIPFMGAMISLKGEVRDRDTEADIAYGGPLAGAAVSLLAAALGLLTGTRLFFVLAYSGFFLNLFNLTPFSPLDGGRIAQAFSRRAWMFGLALLVPLFFVTGSPMLLVIAALGLPRLLARAGNGNGGQAELAELPPAQQRAWALRYFGLAAFLALGGYLSGQIIH
ncbi:MAG: hypothetical protein QM756_25175 [Polyangiaceae bacterium]